MQNPKVKKLWRKDFPQTSLPGKAEKARQQEWIIHSITVGIAAHGQRIKDKPNGNLSTCIKSLKDD